MNDDNGKRASPDKQWTIIKHIVDEALDHEPRDRDAFLDRACATDEALRREVDSLLSHEDASFLESPPPGLPSTAQIKAGTRLGPYEITSQIGAGGMGEVYRATDTRLNRVVAIKTLPGHLSDSHDWRQRFEREARVVSNLNHPNICTLHDIGREGGIDYLVMEFIEGETLSKKLKPGPLSIASALDYGEQIVRGLGKAHSAGIVHRDLKPDNVMVTSTGVKLLDFGLAKNTQTEQLVESKSDEDESSDRHAMSTVELTQHGMLLGTAQYMSPEQTGGHAADDLSDQFSFGATFYEMLTGEPPFRGDSIEAICHSIRNDSPPSLKEQRPELDDRIVAIVGRCLQKTPAQRFSSTDDLQEALSACRVAYQQASRRRWPGRRTLAGMLVASLIIIAVIGRLVWYDDMVRWLERDTLVRVEQLTDRGALNEAYSLIRDIREKIPNDQRVNSMFERFTLPVTIATDPPGANVRVRDYAASDASWIQLGQTPLMNERIPYALMRWEISKQGFETFEGAPFGSRPFLALAQGLVLDATGSRSEEMVRVPGGPFQRLGFRPVELDDFWLDRYEVTNARFKRFVDAGGYDNDEHWSDMSGSGDAKGDSLRAQFVDRSDAPGPSGWIDGNYADGQEDYPVGGVSWYEAAAFCRFEGKQLPTLFHWSAATIQDQVSDIITASNFSGRGAAAVGQHQGMSDFGNYDMAGNVKEWVWNESPTGRYILGGAWNDASHAYRIDTDSLPAGVRSLTNGFRCARYGTTPESHLLGRLVSSFNLPDVQPVSDDIYSAYRRTYAYDHTDLDAKVEATDDSSPYWRKETVSFSAAYGGERVLAHLFLPRNVAPPFQAVLWVPGNDALLMPPGASLASPYLFDFIPRDGRALVYPVYKGTYERQIPVAFTQNTWRDVIVAWSKDLSRTVDYLEERNDIDTDKLGYYGFSAGAVYGPIFTAVDTRFKASALLAGGLVGDFPPEVSTVNFAGRSQVPTLMINGTRDFLTPLDKRQRPLFDLLGAADNDKRKVHLDGGHIVMDRLALRDEVVGWMDRYLGGVE